MCKRTLGHWMAIGFLTLASTSLAKPPDLPIDPRGTCIDGPGGCPERQRGPAEVAYCSEAEAGCPCLDASCPCFCQVLTRWWQQLSCGMSQLSAALPTVEVEILTTMPTAVPSPAAPETATRDQGRRLFQRAEKHFHKGNTSRAYALYRKVHELAPQSDLGRRADQRLRQIETRRPTEEMGIGEDQEPAQSPSRRGPSGTPRIPNILADTVPLETILGGFDFVSGPITEPGELAKPIGKWLLSLEMYLEDY